ncbi:hypothetical protein B0H13DRAFT_212079 [Mycena leptocephala]|nr:hypothetical protein B0H13DRAFT_212079 [Mycena leptocephala]
MATLDNTMGASLLGCIFAAGLYGVSCVQTWYYFNRYGGTDLWYIKTLVGVVFVCDSIHQALISHTVYWYVITNYSHPDALSNLVWSILLEVLFNGLIGLIVQSFLTMRVWRLSNRNIALTVITASLVLAEFGCSVAFTIQSLQLRTWKDLGELKGLSMSVNVLGAWRFFHCLDSCLLSTAISNWIQKVRHHDYQAHYVFRFNGSLDKCLRIGLSHINPCLATDPHICGLLLFDIRASTDDPEDLTFSLQTLSKVPRNMSSIRRPTISIKIETHETVEAERHSEKSCTTEKSQEEDLMIQ